MSRHALIIAGGSGTRLWPVSRAATPKQIIPFIEGRSLLQIAVERLEGLVPREAQYVCAGEAHRRKMLKSVKSLAAERFIGEPTGRDTVNAVGLGAAVIGRDDPQAVIAVFTADHLITPVDEFQRIVAQGFALAEKHPESLVTFGITPTHPATGFGYLQLGDSLPGDKSGKKGGGRVVGEFKEKPDAATAKKYVEAGPDKYLWNSGMFVWRAATLLRAIEKFAPENHAGLMRIAQAWDGKRRRETLHEVYPQLKKISVDFAVMEPASRDAEFKVVAVPMPLKWLDVGSWPAFADACECDAAGNALMPRDGGHVLLDTKNTLVASSDDKHIIATIGCEDLVIVHTPEATLVCPRHRAEDIKKLHALIGERHGEDLL